MTAHSKDDGMREALERMVEHFGEWAKDHAHEATAETWATLHCAKAALLSSSAAAASGATVNDCINVLHQEAIGAHPDRAVVIEECIEALRALKPSSAAASGVGAIKRPVTSNADEWQLWLQEHADSGDGYKAVQIAEAIEERVRSLASEVYSLAEDTVRYGDVAMEATPEGHYYRGRRDEAKSIAKAINAIMPHRPLSSAAASGVVGALRKLAIVQCVRLTHGGGSVPSGQFCQLCNSNWGGWDEAGETFDPGVEHHTDDCALSSSRSAGGSEGDEQATRAEDGPTAPTDRLQSKESSP